MYEAVILLCRVQNRAIIDMEQAQADLDFVERSEQLADFTADLVSLRQYEPFLRELFEKDAGS
jgi:hypothetical protein